MNIDSPYILAGWVSMNIVPSCACIALLAVKKKKEEFLPYDKNMLQILTFF